MNSKKMYLIKRATLHYDDGGQDVLISPIHTDNIEAERERIKEEYTCDKVYFHIDENIGKLLFHINPDIPLVPGIHTVDNCIEAAFGIKPKELQKNCNERDIVDARRFAMWWQRKNNKKLSFQKIGAMYANRDAATAFQAYHEFVPQFLRTNKEFRVKAYKALEFIESIKPVIHE